MELAVIQETAAYLLPILAKSAAGNATYDALKLIFGKSFEKLRGLASKGETKELESTLGTIMEYDSSLLEKLTQLKEGKDISIIMQTHSGTGDIVGRDKIVNN